MRLAHHALKAALVILAPMIPMAGCKAYHRVLGPPPPPSQAELDEPPPLHTGGLSVLGGGPQTQGFGAASHGNAAADAFVMALALAIMGAKTGKTMIDCAKPNATVGCLRGPGPFDYEADAGTPPR